MRIEPLIFDKKTEDIEILQDGKETTIWLDRTKWDVYFGYVIQVLH